MSPEINKLRDLLDQSLEHTIHRIESEFEAESVSGFIAMQTDT